MEWDHIKSKFGLDNGIWKNVFGIISWLGSFPNGLPNYNHHEQTQGMMIGLEYFRWQMSKCNFRTIDESTLRVNHFSPKKMMYNKYHGT